MPENPTAGDPVISSPYGSFVASARNLCARGATLAAIGAWRGAREALGRATVRDPKLAEAWRHLGDILRLSGDDDGAAQADAKAEAAGQPVARHNAASLSAGKLAGQERKLRELIGKDTRPAASVLHEYLFWNPESVAALRMLAEIWRTEREPEIIEALLARALELAPDFAAARRDLAEVLLAQSKWPEALPHVERLLAAAPRDPDLLRLHAETLSAIGETARALDIFAGIAGRAPPREPRFWLAYARALKDAGRAVDSAAAYRTAISLRPDCGAAYWGLADLKSVPLTEADTDAIQALLAGARATGLDRALLHYTLGAACERQRDYAASFAHFADGAALCRAAVAGTVRDYDPDTLSTEVAQAKSVFTEDLFRRHIRPAAHAPTPIFIVGMPRSGSTLIEQILASHSLVEGTQELPALPQLVRSLDVSRRASTPSCYPGCLGELSDAALDVLGADYLRRAAPYRKSDLPYFIDKLPGNWLHAGLVRLILPGAIVIDARRDPMACGFAVFKQYLVGGMNYSYDLRHIGRRIRDYADFMAHLDTASPGLVHGVAYESLVQDTEAEIRRLLDHCDLPFQESCLRFWETARTVRTPSAEQVRRPIFRDALEQWRNYEVWLTPLREGLGLT